MKSTTGIAHFLVACGALLCGVVPFVAAIAADATSAATQQLLTHKESSKVEAVLWSRRSDRYTLQVVFPRPATGIRIEPQKSNTRVALWLLKADGTAISTNAVPASASKPGAPTNEATYWVSLSAGESALAAALKIDDDYFIEALQPLHHVP